MPNPVLQNPHALAVIATLETFELAVGDGIQPPDVLDGAGHVTRRYSVLYPLQGPAPDGSLALPDDDADWRFQLTHIGRTAAEARFQADRAHEALMTGPVTVDGRAIYRVRKIGGSDNVQRDEAVTPPLFYDVALYGLLTTPT